MNNTTTPTLLVLIGPTAVGKTAVAIRLAQWLKTEIVSTDSRQFYREMNIGTAKPTPEERKTVPHQLVDFLSIHDSYDVKSFELEALKVLGDIYTRRDIALATGGSGLYVKTLCEGIDEMPEIDSSIRQKLEEELETKGLPALASIVREKDPVYYATADMQNPRRVMRALEVMEATGKPFSEFRQKSKKTVRPFRVIKIGLDRTREELYKRINIRVDQMVAEGLFEEAQILYPHRQLNALQTVGYQEIFPYLEGKYDREEAIRLIKRNTRRFAKRQLTWFRKDDEIRWFDAGQGESQLLKEIKDYLVTLEIA